MNLSGEPHNLHTFPRPCQNGAQLTHVLHQPGIFMEEFKKSCPLKSPHRRAQADLLPSWAEAESTANASRTGLEWLWVLTHVWWIGSQAPMGPDVANSMGSMLGLLLQDLLLSAPCRHWPLSLPLSVRLLFLPHLCLPVHSSWLRVLRSGCLAAPQRPSPGGEMSMPGPASRVTYKHGCCQAQHGAWGRF